MELKKSKALILVIVLVLIMGYGCAFVEDFKINPDDNHESDEKGDNESGEENDFQIEDLFKASSVDLIPTSISGPTSVSFGSSGYYNSGVQNAGSAASGVFNVKWYAVEAATGTWYRIGYGSHSSVPAYSTVTNGNSSITYQFPYRGSWTLMFYVDCDDYVSESNEGNNQIQITNIIVN